MGFCHMFTASLIKELILLFCNCWVICLYGAETAFNNVILCWAQLQVCQPFGVSIGLYASNSSALGDESVTRKSQWPPKHNLAILTMTLMLMIIMITMMATCCLLWRAWPNLPAKVACHRNSRERSIFPHLPHIFQTSSHIWHFSCPHLCFAWSPCCHHPLFCSWPPPR